MALLLALGTTGWLHTVRGVKVKFKFNESALKRGWSVCQRDMERKRFSAHSFGDNAG